MSRGQAKSESAPPIRRAGSAQTIAACFALSAFAVAVIAGLAAENSAISVLVRALLAMFGCYLVGTIVGMVCQRVVAEQVQTTDPPAASSQAEPVELDGVEEEEILTV